MANDKMSRFGKAGPVKGGNVPGGGKSSDVEDTDKTNLVVKPVTNRGYPGGRDLDSLIAAEKVSVDGVDFAKKGAGINANPPYSKAGGK